MKYSVRNMFRTSAAIVLAASMATTPVFAADSTARGLGTAKTADETMVEPGITDESVGNHSVVNGAFNSGLGGSGSITIKGKSNQTLIGKRFEIFQIFNSQDAKTKESINYTFNPKYKKAVQTVVFEGLRQAGKLTNKEHSYSDIDEYRAIDFIQGLNTKFVEGANATQKENGYYSSFRYFSENLRTEIKNEGLSGLFIKVDSTTAENTAKISGLPFGYYVVDERSTSTVPTLDPQDSKNPTDQWFAASLLMVNTVNKDIEMTVKSDYPSVRKTIQEDDNREKIGNDGYNDIGDYEIGQVIPYRYTSAVPNMNGKDTYFYAFHDKADDALTPYLEKADSKTNPQQTGVKITVKGTDKSGKAKTYTLTSAEYSIEKPGSTAKKPDGKTNVVDAGDTFAIVVRDLKGIVDREFDHKDADGHNDYSDAVVTVDYTMTLNDKAADNTGRPGFENQVRLEFSNNMDSNGGGDTGYTPWDTVVAFTFKLNGLKTNDHDKALEGAKFRIYSDKEMKNEVILKEKPNTKTSTGAELPGNQDNDQRAYEEQGAGTAAQGQGGSAQPSKDVNGTGTVTDVAAPTGAEKATMGNNGYIVVNRDSVGGDDHTGGRETTGVEIVSDAKGNFTIYGLDEGTYYLKETQAPDGYRLLEKPIELKINPTYVADRNNYVKGDGATDKALAALDVTAEINTFYKGAFEKGNANLSTSLDEGSADLVVVNEVGSKLPVTGSSAMLVMLGAGVAMMGGSLLGRKKKEDEE